jgi:opacity protein-like surface antigen
MMRKVYLFAVIFSMFFVMSVNAQIGLKGLGVQVGYVSPEDPIESTIGFGARVDLGTLSNKNIAVGAMVNYWSKEYDLAGANISISQIAILPYAHFQFSSGGSAVPYVGGGIGFQRGSSESTTDVFGTTFTASSSSTGLAYFGAGGVKMNFSNSMSGFAEAAYMMGDINSLNLLVGLMFSL